MEGSYSETWFRTFLAQSSGEQNKVEVDFLLKIIRQHHLQTVLDIACGIGRHAGLLTNYGLNVTGIDYNGYIIEKARKTHPDVEFVELDMRDLDNLAPAKFDLVILLWQSFGYYSDEVNNQILQQIHDRLNQGGRFVIDIYNPEFFDNHQGIRKFERNNQKITETKFIKNKRLTVQLDYSGNEDPDTFSWRLYEVEEFTSILEGIGFNMEQIVSEFSSDVKPSEDNPRIQYVASKSA